jgi:hypothetical protein
MELTDKEAQTIKNIYDRYFDGILLPEEALQELELLFNV